jgi:hypothetical protein
VDPKYIQPTRTRRNRAPVDYSSAEALAKAGLTKEALANEDAMQL